MKHDVLHMTLDTLQMVFQHNSDINPWDLDLCIYDTKTGDNLWFGRYAMFHNEKLESRYIDTWSLEDDRLKVFLL